MHIELGSEFEIDLDELEPQSDSIYDYLGHFYTIYLDSGRSAATALNTLIDTGTILLPDYICDCVIRVYETKFEIKYYHVLEDFTVDLDDLMKKIDHSVTAVYLMHYFGTLQKEQVLACISSAREKYGFLIIEDTTHSIFTKSCTIGDYCICSLRKWFAITDGAVLYSQKDLSDIDLCHMPVKPVTRKLIAMILKKLYIDDMLDCNQLYRGIFEEEEQKLDRQEQVYRISDFSASLLKNYSVSKLIKKRKDNYRMLIGTLVGKGMEVIFPNDVFVPLACPIYLEDRDRFRRYLSEHQVYCAVHWPLEKTDLYAFEESRNKSERMISLPVDQRYGSEHMRYLQELLRNYN